MTGSIAQTIQGEAGANPANQFAVASTIWNRMQAGNFPGGADPNAIVNAPQQFVGFAATPNTTASAFAAAIQNGSLGNYGNTGNAVNFQSGQTAANNGFTNGGTNIGGNFFSDRFGAPTSNFVAPSYGGGVASTGVPDNAQGGTPASGSGDPLGWSVTQNPSGTSLGNDQGTPNLGGGVSQSTTPGSQPGTTEGQTQLPVSLGVQPGFFTDINNSISTIMTGAGTAVNNSIKAAETAVGTLFGSVQNWFVRAFLIIVGIIVVAVALAAIMWNHGGKETVVNMGRAVAA